MKLKPEANVIENNMNQITVNEPKLSKRNLYLDYSASTPVDPIVLEKMMSFFTENFANPSSQHRAGWQSLRAVDGARKQIAQLLKARMPKEIVFTSGASESNTLAILGFIQSIKKQFPEKKLHALTSKIEHKSVLETFQQIEELGVEVDYLQPNSFGQIEIETVKNSIKDNTVLMSFMWANNEIGSLNPIKELSLLSRQYKICFHSDATQACGKFPLDLQNCPVDFISLSGHKMYGPKGVGALYIRHEGHQPAYSIWPIIRGGSQENKIRAGTLNVPGIVGLGEAAEIALTNMTANNFRLEEITRKFYEDLLKIYPNLKLNGHPIDRIPGHLHLTFPQIRWDQWLPRLSQLCVSTTSACNSENIHGSHVLGALHFSLQEIQSSLRISLGKFTTEEELAEALGLFQKVFKENQ